VTVAAPERIGTAAHGLSAARKMALDARIASGRRGPARIVVIGEFNSGKTALVNALAGTCVLPASAVHHTPCPIVIGHGRKRAMTARRASGERMALDDIGQLNFADTTRLDVRLPLPALKGVHIVDTPGLGLGSPQDDASILKACRGADLIIWCTPAFQAWKHSERTLWLSLPRHTRRQGVLAVTFWDAVSEVADLNRLLARLHTDAGPHFRDIVLACSHTEPAP
jgi:GTPase Era involved in 16S rRNA processing